MNAPATRVAFNGVAAAAEASGLRPHHIRQGLASGELRFKRIRLATGKERIIAALLAAGRECE